MRRSVEEMESKLSRHGQATREYKRAAKRKILEECERAETEAAECAAQEEAAERAAQEEAAERARDESDQPAVESELQSQLQDTDEVCMLFCACL